MFKTMTTKGKPNENLGSLCPFCQKGHLNKVTHTCNECKLNFLEINLARTSGLIAYRGQGMSTHAGIIAALSFGLFSIAQILLIKDLPDIIFIIFFLLFFGFQLFGFYEIHRFTEYRRIGRFHEMMLSDLKALSIVDDSELLAHFKEKKNKKKSEPTSKSKSNSNSIYQSLIIYITRKLKNKKNINLFYSIFIIIIDITIILYRTYDLALKLCN